MQSPEILQETMLLPRCEVVAAIDLLDEGDPRAVGIADRIIERAFAP